MIDVEQWAEIRRMHFVDGVSIREIHRCTGVHRETISRAQTRQVPVVLGTHLANRAAHLYRRFGFQEFDRTDTHILMELNPTKS